MTAKNMEAYYAARAPEYDRVYLKPERQQDQRAIQQYLPSVFHDLSVLEVACGTGYWTQFFAPAAKEVVALDASIETLNIARARPGTEKARFMVGDAYRLPISSVRFDAAFAGFWYSHVPRGRLDEFLQGFHASLNPGARVVLLDNRFVEGSSTPIAEQDDEGNTYQWRRLEDGTDHRVLKNFPTEAELRQAVGAAASDLRYHEWQYFWALEYVVAAH